MTSSEEIGQRLKLARKSRGLTQTDVAKALGVTYQQVQKYERGGNRITVGALIRLNEELGMDFSDIIPLDKKNIFPDLTEEEHRLLEYYRSIKDAELKKRLLRLVGALKKE